MREAEPRGPGRVWPQAQEEQGALPGSTTSGRLRALGHQGPQRWQCWWVLCGDGRPPVSPILRVTFCGKEAAPQVNPEDAPGLSKEAK